MEELDQHLVMGVNTLSCEEWDASFGWVYKQMIDEGIESIMAGHIALPAYSRKLCPGIAAFFSCQRCHSKMFLTPNHCQSFLRWNQIPFFLLLMKL